MPNLARFFFFNIPNPELQIREIPDLEKRVGDPPKDKMQLVRLLNVCLRMGLEQSWVKHDFTELSPQGRGHAK